MCSKSEKIEAGDWVAIQRDNFVKIHKINEGAVALLGRDCVELGTLLNQPKWSTYSLEEKGKKCVRKFTLKVCDSVEFEENVADKLVDEIVDGKDNRFIKDDGQSQKLSKEEIEGMQSDGVTPKEIIGQLVENSSTFDKKTAYAQEKYLNKKQKKYIKKVLIRPTSIRLILQALIGPTLDATKILGLRIDSLGQLVYMSGAQSGAGTSTYILFESGSQGMVSSAILEKLGDETDSHLIVIGPTRGSNKCMPVQAMNFSNTQLDKVHYVTFTGFLTKAREEGLIIEEKEENSNSKEENSNLKNEKTSNEETSKEEEEKSDVKEEKMEVEGEKSLKRPSSGTSESHASKRTMSADETEIRFCIDRLKTAKADSLIIVGKENPCDIAEVLLPLIAFSRPVVIYSQFREPLQETYMKLKVLRSVTALRLSEPWYRKYQVLPERTHPEVSMSSSGGYLLTGITVDIN